MWKTREMESSWVIRMDITEIPSANMMPAQTDLLRGLEAKQPKLVASTVTALKQIVTSVWFMGLPRHKADLDCATQRIRSETSRGHQAVGQGAEQNFRPFRQDCQS